MNILDCIDKYESETVGVEHIITTEKYIHLDHLNHNLNKFPNNLKAFYKMTNGYGSEWETEEAIANGKSIYGKIKLLPSEDVLSDWEGTVYFKDNPDSGMENFKIVDFFWEQSCVGFFYDESETDGDLMMYYDFEDFPMSLDVNFSGYLELLFMARGYYDWQRILLHFNGEEKNEEFIKQFKKYMPKLFPDFKWDEFVALYEKVKIK